MANVTDFTQDSVLYFLRSNGGTVKNSDLLFHFKAFLRDHEDRTRYREQFKKFVNSVATVKQDEGVVNVVLRKKFRGHLPGNAVVPPGGGQSPRQARLKPDQAKPRDRTPEKKTTWQPSAQISPLLHPKPPQTTESFLLASAGIHNNNNHDETTNFNLEKPLQSSSPLAPKCAKKQPHASTNFPYHTKGTASEQNSKAEVAPLPEFTPRDQPIYTGAQLGQLSSEPLDHHQRRNHGPPPTDLQPSEALDHHQRRNHCPPPTDLQPSEALDHHQRRNHCPPPTDLQPSEPLDHHQRRNHCPPPTDLQPSEPLDHHQRRNHCPPPRPDLQPSEPLDHHQRRNHCPPPDLQPSEPLDHHQRRNHGPPPTDLQPSEPLDHHQRRNHGPPPTDLQPKAAPLKPEEIPKQESGIGGGGPRFDQQVTRFDQQVTRFDQQVTRRRAKHRQSYKSAVSYDDGGDFDDDEEEEDQRRPGPAVWGAAQPVNVPRLEQTGRAIISSFSMSVRDRKDNLPGCRRPGGGVPVICIWGTEEDREATHHHGPPRLSLGLEPGLRVGQDPGDSKPPRSSLPLEAECYVPTPDDGAEYTEPYHDQSHHNVNLDPSEQRLDPGLGSGLDPVLDSGVGSKLDPVLASGLDSGLGSSLDPGLGSGLDPVLDSGVGSKLDPGLDPVLDSGLGSRLDPVLDSGLGSSLDPGLGPAGLRPKLGPGAGLSTSHNSVFPASSEEYSTSSDWPRFAALCSEWDSSDEALHTSTGELDSESKVQETLQRAKETKLLALMHRAERKSTTPWHHSTGHLVDDAPTDDDASPPRPPWRHSTDRLHDVGKEGAESSDGSPSSVVVVVHRPSAARRVSSRIRSRLCRSLGADLDQPFAGDGRRGGAAARQNRLHLLSSSLSLGCSLSSLSSSSQSLSDLAEVEKGDGGMKGLPSSSSSKFHQQPDLVPLEPKVHLWLVNGAVGSWTDIYSLFRDDPTLLNRRDFITGYTVLHWIAKHGDHRVLNTLGYGVNKAGVALDVDARSACGYTPLHLAALHGHKKMMRLLVQKFKASVALRDTSGKKAWQYVDRPAPLDILHLLGAPQWAFKRGAEEVGSQQRLHHSSSSVDKRHHHARPPVTSGTTKVKRSSSIAAFLKHKSIARLTGQFSDFHV